MGKILSIAALTLFIIAGFLYGQSANPFFKKNTDLFIEGWYEVDGDGKLTGLFTLDITNSGSSAWSQIDYYGVPDFYECSTKPQNWTCQYDPNSGRVSFIIDSGLFAPHDRINFVVMYKKPLTKKLTRKGYLDYQNSEKKKNMVGLTRIEAIPEPASSIPFRTAEHH